MGDERAAKGTRVVLLARPGQACERLREALQQAGAELVLVADPTAGNPDAVIAAAPQAVLVALDSSVEDALEHFDAVLANPDITVIFDEAEMAAQRAGWDSARWVRHLAAKLNRHQDVLPPGGEADTEWHPSPGRIEPPSERIPQLDIAPFTGEAQQIADELPRDPGLHAQGLSLVDDLVFDVGDAAKESDMTGLDAPVDSGVDADTDAATDADADADADTDTDTDTDTAPETDIGIDLYTDGDTDTGAAGEPALRVQNPAFVRDLEDLDRRVAGIELADVDSYGHGPRRGAVLIEAGLGGPDAVRQLLGELPEGFPRPVLVRLRLDGGRYDRLVKQMERATRLSVKLAASGQAAEAGNVYFMAPELGLVEQAAKLVFSDAVGAASLFAVLPSSDSAVLFLSGSDPALVEVAMNPAWSGALVAGQAPEGCYDAMASTEVIARGGASGSASELAGQLAERWPS